MTTSTQVVCPNCDEMGSFELLNVELPITATYGLHARCVKCETLYVIEYRSGNVRMYNKE